MLPNVHVMVGPPTLDQVRSLRYYLRDVVPFLGTTAPPLDGQDRVKISLSLREARAIVEPLAVPRFVNWAGGWFGPIEAVYRKVYDVTRETGGAAAMIREQHVATLRWCLERLDELIDRHPAVDRQPASKEKPIRATIAQMAKAWDLGEASGWDAMAKKAEGNGHIADDRPGGWRVVSATPEDTKKLLEAKKQDGRSQRRRR